MSREWVRSVPVERAATARPQSANSIIFVNGLITRETGQRNLWSVVVMVAVVRVGGAGGNVLDQGQ